LAVRWKVQVILIRSGLEYAVTNISVKVAAKFF